MPYIPLASIPLQLGRVYKCHGRVLDWSGAVLWAPSRVVVFALDWDRASAVVGDESGKNVTVLLEYYTDQPDCYSASTGDDVLMRVRSADEVYDDQFLAQATRAFVRSVKQ